MKYGLIGEKLGHSFSKEIHERIGKYEYELVELNKEQFKTFMMERNFFFLNRGVWKWQNRITSI